MSEGYVQFQSARPAVTLTFLYPVNWQVREIEKGNTLEIFIAGPRSPLGTCAAALTIRASEAPQETLQEVVTAFLSRCRLTPGFQERGKSLGTVAGCPAVEVEIGYPMPLPLNNVNARPTPVYERHIFLKREEQLYDLSYMALAEYYTTWLKAFRTLVQTFMFLEEPTETIFQPLISAQTIREETPEYKSQEESSG